MLKIKKLEFTENDSNTGVIFWAMCIIFSFVGLAYMIGLGITTHNAQMTLIALMFGTMLTFSLVISNFISKDTFFKETYSFTKVTTSFLIGFVSWFAFATISTASKQSIFSTFTISNQNLLASVSSQMPPIWGWFINCVSAPIVEEAFFLIALPSMLFYIIFQIKEEFPPIVALLIVLPMAAISFRIFHTGQSGAVLSVFGIAAIIFRSIQIFLRYSGSKAFDFIPLPVCASFAVGAHMANNMVSSGISKVWTLVIFEPIGFITIGILLIFLLTPVLSLMRRFL